MLTSRALRQPPSQAVFDGRLVPVSIGGDWLGRTWYRLSRREYPSQFFPSKGSRLTPISGEFPCVYLATEMETTVAEVWGDRLDAQRDAGGDTYVIPSGQAAKWAFLKLNTLPSDLRLCDLTSADTRLAMGLDGSSLYATDFDLTQTWAERVARHPHRFDGMRYRSRHTDELCLVLWVRPSEPRPLDQRVQFLPAGEFLRSDAAYILAGKVGIRLAFLG
jgi:hypothetical protein